MDKEPLSLSPCLFCPTNNRSFLIDPDLTSLCGFSLVASSIYIFNDYRDREEDRLHPTKKNRPLLRGSLPVSRALGIMVVLLSGGLISLYLIHPHALFWALGYVVLNLSYSLALKQIPIVDLYLIALGFVIRIALGASLETIPLSMWIILMTFY